MADEADLVTKKDMRPRLYQKELFEEARRRNVSVLWLLDKQASAMHLLNYDLIARQRIRFSNMISATRVAEGVLLCYQKSSLNRCS